MRKTYNKLLTFAFALIILGCSDEEKVIDQVFKDVNSETPFLRILNVTGSNLDLFNLSSTHAWELEYQVIPNNPSLDQLQSVAFQVAFTDNFDDGTDNSAGPVAFGSLSASDFTTPGDFGNLKTDFSYTLQDALDALGLVQSQLNGGDTFLVTWEMTLTDGRTIGPNDVSGDVAAVGGYYSSQYQLQSSLVCIFDEPDFFTGTYQIDQLTGSDPFFASETFGTQTVEITGSGTSRSFVFIYYPGNFDFEQEFTMNFVCDRILFSSTSVSGTLGCGDGTITQGNTPDTPTFFDQTFVDDTDIILYIQDFDSDAGCGTGPNQITVRLTKV
jgi:hypothetical protein